MRLDATRGFFSDESLAIDLLNYGLNINLYHHDLLADALTALT